MRNHHDMRSRAVVPTNILLTPDAAELLSKLKASSGRSKAEIVSIGLNLYASTVGKVKVSRQEELELEEPA